MSVLVTGGTGTVGSAVVKDLASRDGLIAGPEAIARQTRLLGHAPRAFSAFASETAAAWLAGS